jgi:hypothetical protein
MLNKVTNRMPKPWVPVPYYYTSPLAKVKPPTALPHPLGYIPKYLRVRLAV